MAAPRENTVTVITANASMAMDPLAMDIVTSQLKPPKKKLILPCQLLVQLSCCDSFIVNITNCV